MHDWNVVATSHTHGYSKAWEVLKEYGRVRKTEFHSVLTMKVDDIRVFAERLLARMQSEAEIEESISRVMPVSAVFTFQTPEEFEAGVKNAMGELLPAFDGKTFYLRMHRRGYKGRLSSQAEERVLAQFLLERLAESGRAARVDFEDPDLVLAIETVGQRGGTSLWTREDRRRYPFLKLD